MNMYVVVMDENKQQQQQQIFFFLLIWTEAILDFMYTYFAKK